MGVIGAPGRGLFKPGHFWLQEAESHSSFLREKGVYWKDKHSQKSRCQELRLRLSAPPPSLPLPEAVGFLRCYHLPRILLLLTHNFHPAHHPSRKMSQPTSSQGQNFIGPNQPSKLGYTSHWSACGVREVSRGRSF